MNVDGKQMRPIWFDTQSQTVQVIDQRFLPHKLIVEDLKTVDQTIYAIKEMFVRGAPLIGATGALGVYISLVQKDNKGADNAYLVAECHRLKNARPTAMNLFWGVDRVMKAALKHPAYQARVTAALDEALAVIEEEAVNCQKIGEYGLPIIEAISKKKNGEPVNILTHCNAGWLACIEYGTATAPVYTAFDNGIDVHVWVDETRPLNQGSRLTAWELGKHGVKHTVITDNAGGHIMQHGMVDLVIVGTDRTTRAGDVANKIGTYLKALAAKDNHIPFYVALPSSTFDWSITDGIADIPIEQRDPDEIRYVQGLCNGKIEQVLVPPETSAAANHAFDVTPARLVTGFITERGVCKATEQDIMAMFPDKKTN
ncbi:MAG: S-methyl-5-thioribose-1-phosphate isomerase [Proteobacteria bacterium]|nr:S-methyl-5-thioribose-1-phosphate isomerase [Pseudomonadota bacterium]MBU1388698.1 S-methyl-5-thioribose-1-phosphate isomerase [Pseudomonadota bacterium]MBU1541908.1 S-methyl-5-thioribose-1-phosphate isomerase [Pseudomonadota bacterium]MBU2431561.1 S-methyl-5-thioribose-1-phosphate isomerase [Pseudomonadota bacterium]MBU2480866.1 S-methyl-5-thioribose-1-phosphate isomerase [Pseudomonadota bacterium]